MSSAFVVTDRRFKSYEIILWNLKRGNINTAGICNNTKYKHIDPYLRINAERTEGVRGTVLQSAPGDLIVDTECTGDNSGTVLQNVPEDFTVNTERTDGVYEIVLC